MGKEDYQRVRGELQLADEPLIPIVVTLPADPIQAISLDKDLALRDSRNENLVVLTIEEIFEWVPAGEAQEVFDTQNPRHSMLTKMHS